MSGEDYGQTDEARRTRAGIACAEAEVAFAAGDLDAAAAGYRVAGDEYRALCDGWALANCLHQFGVVCQYQGDYAGAEPLLQESLALAMQLGDAEAQARTLHQLGRSRLQAGDYAGADAVYARSLSIKTELGDRAAMASTLHQMGMLRRLQGNLTEAAEFYGLSLVINRRLEDWPGIGGTLAELGRLRLLEGDNLSALADSWQALSIFHGTSRPEAASAAITILDVRRRIDAPAFAEAAAHAGITREVVEQVEDALSQHPTPAQ
ncbi:MAG: tetratricopeptide repeat protein [Chloroflexia bacterium]